MAYMHVWTTREVSFQPFPTEVVDADAVLEALCAHFYDRPVVRRFLGAVISGDERGFEVTGLPWWMPSWSARRMVTRILAGQEVAGEATCRTVRIVLNT
jgi:hypothetical protein